MSTGLDAHPGRRAARWVAPVGLCGGAVCLLTGAAVYLGAAPDPPPAMWAEDTDGAGTAALQAASQADRFRPPIEEETGGAGIAALQAASQADRFRPPIEEETGGAGTAALQEATPDAPLETRAGIQLPAAAKDLALAAVAVLGTILVSVGAVFALLDRIGVLAAVTVLRRGVEAPEPRHDLPAPESLSGVAAPDRNDPAEVPALAPDHGTGPRGAGAYAPGAGRPGAEPVRGAELSPARAGGLVSEEAAGPEPGVQSPEPRAPVREAAAPPLSADEPPLEPPRPGDLIDAWDDYRRNGDGHFSPRGLQEVLDQWGLDADVDHGDRVGAGSAVLIVETFGTRNFYVLPSFNKSPRAVADWFDDDSGGALTARTQRVTRVAQGRWVEPGSENEGRFEVLGRGEVQ